MCRLEDERWIPEWKPDPTKVVVELIDARNSIPRFLANTLFSSQPFNMAKYNRSSFAKKIEAEISLSSPDAVHFDGLHTACYAPLVAQKAPGALRVLRCHNAEYVILERLAEAEPNPLKRALIALQARRVKRYEAQMLDHFDLILAITETDAERFRAMNPSCSNRIMVVPAGTNLPSELPPEPDQTSDPIRLIHIAAMDWLPNQGGLRWLRDEVIPLLDAAGFAYHLDVIGKSMPEEFKAMSGPRITVHGFVKDLQPLVQSAHIAVVPLQVGSGMRVKILDYWAMGIPMVATRVAAEGLDGGDQPVVALADEPDAFAQTIMRLAKDPSERRALRAAGFAKVTAGYGWAGLTNQLVQRYGTMLASDRENADVAAASV
jgi:glycosyltransferase involved in cell wall biosynthesis